MLNFTKGSSGSLAGVLFGVGTCRCIADKGKFVVEREKTVARRISTRVAVSVEVQDMARCGEIPAGYTKMKCMRWGESMCSCRRR